MTVEPDKERNVVERKVVCGDAVIAAREEGHGATTVVFSHGGFLTMGLFDPVVALMSGTARCVRWDHRGQGASTAGSGWGRRDYLERLYTDALSVIDHFEVTSCHWVGHSIGAYVGMRVAANHPELLRSLVLLSPRVRANPMSFKLRLELLSQVLIAASHSRRLDDPVRDKLAAQAMGEMLGTTFTKDPRRSDDRERFHRDLHGRLTPAVLPALVGTVWYPENQPQMIAEITTPTLIIAGEEDHSSDNGVEHAREVATLIRDSTLMTVPEAGHALLVEQPDKVAMTIRDFIDEHRGLGD